MLIVPSKRHTKVHRMYAIYAKRLTKERENRKQPPSLSLLEAQPINKSYHGYWVMIHVHFNQI